ncbi:MAG TPA: hypothetical protein VFA78_02455 [Chloroflexota bacterium]|nr:hypothetical protein [Chloroflexota bacterium]
MGSLERMLRRQQPPKQVRKPDDFQRWILSHLDRREGAVPDIVPRPLGDIIKELGVLYDILLALVETNAEFDPEKNARIMDRYDSLVNEFRASWAYARRRGISLHGLTAEIQRAGLPVPW